MTSLSRYEKAMTSLSLSRQEAVGENRQDSFYIHRRKLVTDKIIPIYQHKTITLVTALMNWLPVFHLHWLGHVPHVRQHLPTTIVWNSPMRELIGSVMVSSPLLLTFGTLSLLLYFRLPSTFLPSKGRSITTLGTRWHDFFHYSF